MIGVMSVSTKVNGTMIVLTCNQRMHVKWMDYKGY